MKARYMIMSMMLVLLSVATSCKQEDMPPSVTDSDVVEVSATIGGRQTKVSQTSDNKYVFDTGDAIHIIGWYGDSEPWETGESWWNDAVSTFNGRKWKTEPYMRWQNGTDLQHHFLAWWPEEFADSMDDLSAISFDVDGKSAEDILLARWSGTRTEDNKVNLQFGHIMSSFDVHLIFKEQYSGVTNISVMAEVCNDAQIDILSQPVEFTLGDKSENVTLIKKAKSADDAHWSGNALVIPQKCTDCKVIITFELNGEQTTLEYKHPAINFVSGKRSTLTLTIGRDENEFEFVVLEGYAPDSDDSEFGSYLSY